MPKVTNPYKDFTHLTIEGPVDGILTIVMGHPGGDNKLSSANAGMHFELAEIWRVLDRDPEVNCAIIKGRGKGFSAGGDFELVQEMSENFDTRARVWREAKDLVYNVINCNTPIVSAMHGPAVGAGLVAGLLADISIATKSARIIDGHTRLGVAAGDHAAIIWPLLIGMAKAKYHLMLCEPMNGEEAERMGLISLCVEEGELEAKAQEVAERLCKSSHTAVRWTKYSLNNWLRMAGPSFDTSLALEFMGFAGPDVHEGVASLKEKRLPNFKAKSPF
jgi:enoyl-CoA hydratase